MFGSGNESDGETLIKGIIAIVALFVIGIYLILFPTYSLDVVVEPVGGEGSICVSIFSEGFEEESDSQCEATEKETLITFSGLKPGKYWVYVKEVRSSGEGKPSVLSDQWETVEVTEDGENTVRISMHLPEETGG